MAIIVIVIITAVSMLDHPAPTKIANKPIAAITANPNTNVVTFPQFDLIRLLIKNVITFPQFDLNRIVTKL